VPVRARLLALIVMVVIGAGALFASAPHRSSTTLADQVCFGLGTSYSDGVCFPTPS